MVPFLNFFPVICICPEAANLDMIIRLRPAEARLGRRLLHMLYTSYIY